jgi:hypothetical protein
MNSGVLDGAALHAVAGKAVGMLDVLGDVGGGQRAQRPGIGLDQQAYSRVSRNGGAGAVVDFGKAVVAPAEDPIADRDGHRAVVDVLAELAERARTCSRAAALSAALVA